MCHHCADGDRGVESTAGDAADGEGHREDRKADRQAVIRVARCTLGGGGIEHHPAERKGAEKLRERRRPDLELERREWRVALQVECCHRRHNTRRRSGWLPYAEIAV